MSWSFILRPKGDSALWSTRGDWLTVNKCDVNVKKNRSNVFCSNHHMANYLCMYFKTYCEQFLLFYIIFTSFLYFVVVTVPAVDVVNVVGQSLVSTFGILGDSFALSNGFESLVNGSMLFGV